MVLAEVLKMIAELHEGARAAMDDDQQLGPDAAGPVTRRDVEAVREPGIAARGIDRRAPDVVGTKLHGFQRSNI